MREIHNLHVHSMGVILVPHAALASTSSKADIYTPPDDRPYNIKYATREGPPNYVADVISLMLHLNLAVS